MTYLQLYNKLNSIFKKFFKINNIKKSYDNVYELIQKMKNKDNK